MQYHSSGTVNNTLRAEGLLVLITSCILFDSSNYSWSTFFVWFLFPDIAFLGYLINQKFGAIFYNSTHSYIGPMILFILSNYFNISNIIIFIWFAHIGFDRLLGYGLKYSIGFKHTHLGLIGKKAP